MKNFEEFKKNLKNKIFDKIKKGEPLTPLDNLVLQDKYEIYDPQVKAYRQVSLEDYFNLITSLNK